MLLYRPNYYSRIITNRTTQNPYSKLTITFIIILKLIITKRQASRFTFTYRVYVKINFKTITFITECKILNPIAL